MVQLNRRRRQLVVVRVDDFDASPTDATIEVRNEGTPTLRIDAPPVER
ncbi:hypothetical protein [Saltatorellus ferox]